MLELKVCATMPGKRNPQDGPPLSAEVLKRDAAHGLDVRLQHEGVGAGHLRSSLLSKLHTLLQKT